MYKNKYLLIICISMFSTQSNAQKLKGKVISAKTGLPIEAASVYISDLKLAVTTDSSGNYSFKKLPAGTFLVEVHSVGYKTITENITFTDNSTKDFDLPENIIEQNEVVVTGLSKATQIRRSPIPIVAISKAYLRSNINTNIIDAISKVPGITSVTTGPNISKPYIRGLGFNRILTLYDGVRQEGQQWGDEHGIEVDQYAVERIEVVKGPASLSYGSDALAGVVNLIPDQPAAEGKITGDILSEFHSNNGMTGTSAMIRGTKNGFEWLTRISNKQATNYQNKIDGRVYGTAFKERDATVYLGIHRGWGFSHLSFSLFDDKQKIPDGSRDTATEKFTKQITEADILRPIVSDEELRSYKIDGTYQHVQHLRLYNNNNFIIGNGRLTVNLSWQKSHRQEFSHPEYLTVPGLDLDLNTYNYDLRYYLRELQGWNISFGVNGMYQKNDVTKGTDFIIPSYQQFDAGPFFYLKKTINKIDISGGVRYDSRSFSNKQLYTKADPVTGFDLPVTDTAGADHTFSKLKTSFSGVSGSIGFTYNATEKLSLKLNAARGYRAPNVSEISANGVHPGTNTYQIGKPDFKAEFSNQVDLGFVYASKYVVINTSLFVNNIENYIYNQKLVSATGEDSIIVAGNQTFKFHQGKARLFGGEMNIDFHPVKNIHFENSFSLVNGLNKSKDLDKASKDSSKYLPFIPPFHCSSELRYDFAANHYRIANGFIKLQLVYYAAQNKVYLADNTESPTPGYTLLNMGIGSGITNKKGKTLFNLSLMANNLFDVSYYDHLSRLKYFTDPASPDPERGIHNMGRNVSFRIEVPF